MQQLAAAAAARHSKPKQRLPTAPFQVSNSQSNSQSNDNHSHIDGHAAARPPLIYTCRSANSPSYVLYYQCGVSAVSADRGEGIWSDVQPGSSTPPQNGNSTSKSSPLSAPAQVTIGSTVRCCCQRMYVCVQSLDNVFMYQVLRIKRLVTEVLDYYDQRAGGYTTHNKTPPTHTNPLHSKP